MNNALRKMVMCALIGALSIVARAADVVFATGGDSEWFKQSTVKYGNQSAWQSGDLSVADDTTSWISMTVQGPCILSFQFGFQGTSLSYGCYLDGEYISLDCGWGSSSPAWRKNELAISSPGEHEVEIECWGWSGSECAQAKYWIADVQCISAPAGVTVSFDANGGSCATSRRYYETGAEYSEMPTPEHSFGEFLGWYTEKIGGEKVTESDYVRFDVTQLYAHWGMSIEDALDVANDPNISISVDTDWETGDPEWYGNAGISYDGNGCACAGTVDYGNTFSATVSGAGTLSFVAKCVSGWLDVCQDGNQLLGLSGSSGWTYSVDGYTVKKSSSNGWTRFDIEAYGADEHEFCFGFDGYSYNNSDSYALVDDMSWTPASGSAIVRLENAPGSFLADRTYEAGANYGTLPEPTRAGYVFAGWFTDENLMQQVGADDFVPFTGAHLYAKWKKTIELDNSNWYECLFYPTGETVYRTDVIPDGGDETGYGASYTSYIEFEVTGAGFFSFWLNLTGSVLYNVAVDGKSVDWKCTTFYSWQKQGLTISGTGKHTIRVTVSDSYGTGAAFIKDTQFDKYKQQDTFGEWTDKTCNHYCWITDNLSALQAKYAKDTTPKGRVLHAITTLLTAGENTSLQSLYKTFGYTFDYMTMLSSGTFNASTAKAGNSVVDTIITVGEPLVKTALSDLETISSSMEPFEVTTADCAYFDESVTFDYGDILYLRSALKGLLGFAYWTKSYNTQIDYSQGKNDYCGVELPTVTSEAKLKTEAGWSSIDWLPSAESYFAYEFVKRDVLKAAKAGSSVYVYVAHNSEVVDSVFLNVQCRDATTDEILKGYYYPDMDDFYASFYTLASPVAELDGATVYRLPVTSSSGVKIASLKLQQVSWATYSADDFQYLAWRASDTEAERHILNQTKLADKIRNSAALAMAKGHVKEALNLWLQADAKVDARVDGNILHLIEYDYEDEDQMLRLDRMRTNVAKAFKSLNDGSVQEYDTGSDVLPDPLVAKVGELFTGNLTRSLLPKSTSNDYYIPNMDALDPTLNGLLPETTCDDWIKLLDDKKVEYYTKPYTLTVKNGYIYTYDETTGEEKYVKSLEVSPGEEVFVDFDYTLIYDEESGEEHGAFQGWSVSDTSIDLGEDFDANAQNVAIVMPNKSITLTGNYIANVAGYLMFGAGEIGEGDAASFYWSIDGGKTKIPCDDGETMLPVAAGKVTVSFYAIDNATGEASSAWYAPASRTYDSAMGAEGWEEIYEMVWFVAKDGSKSVTFDANGGLVSPSSMYFIDGGEYYELPEPTRNGYIFNGWYTAKTDGEQVYEYDDVDFELLDTNNPTLYAHWLKAYTLTVKTAQTVTSKGFAPEIYVNDELYENAINIMQDDYVWLAAPELVYDANEEEYVFKSWTVSAKSDLGEGFNAESCETEIVMPAADITMTATYRPRYVKVPVTVTSGFTYDLNGEQAAKATLYAGESADLEFDDDKLVDAKSGETIGAFQRWTWEPTTVTAEDLGEDFDMFSPETSFIVPDVSGTKAGTFKITAQYVSPVAGYVTYDFLSDGYAEEDSKFYWSPDNGKTLIPSGQTYPLVAGTIKALAFYAKNYEGETSAYWKAPASVSLTIPKRGTYKESGVTYYEEPTYVDETEWFVAADGAKQITFNANGGKCTVTSRWYLDRGMGGSYYTLPTPAARSGYIFDGWQTAKAGGEKVNVGDWVYFSILDAKKPTLYARWLKAYTLTLKGTDVTAEYNGEICEKSLSVLEGGSVTLYAPDSYEDASGNNYLFQCWTPSSTKVDLGTDYAASSSETTIIMPAAKLTMTATYVKESEAAYITMYATDEIAETVDVAVEADPSQFYWSTDGKSWFQSGTTALVKKGKYTIQWKSTNSVWSAPTAKTSVTVAAGDDYSNEDNPAVFTFVMSASVTAVVYENGDWYESTEGGTATMNPTDGRLVSGKSIAFTAKANKNYVFVGWQFEKQWKYGLSPYTTSEKLTMSSLPTYYIDEEDYKVHFQAVFRPISDYKEEDMYNAFSYVSSECINYCIHYDSNYDDDPLAGTVELQAAVGCEAYFTFGMQALAQPLTYQQTGKLPSGLKVDSAAKYGYFALTGTPTAAGTYNFTVTAKDPAGNKCSLAVTLTVRKLDVGIAGDYRALMTDYDTGAIAGLLEMSVTSAGKVSGKITTVAGGTVSLTPSLVWCPDLEDPDGVGTFGVAYYKITGSEKSGSYVDFSAYFGDEDHGGSYANYGITTWKNGEYTSSSMSGNLVCADQSWLKDEYFAASFLGKYYTIQLTAEDAGAVDEEEGCDGYEECASSVYYRTPTELMAPGYLTVTTDKNGAVKVAGKLADGEKISASTVLLPSSDGTSASAIIMVVPSSYKKNGCVALQLEFSEDGYVSSSLGTWITPPLMTAISGVELGEMALQGKLALSAYGTIYSALSDLTDYYMSLWVSIGDVEPQLEYTYTENKVKIYDYVSPFLSEFGLESDMLTGGKNGKITVGTSGTPWKQSDGSYNYWQTKKGEDITNPAGMTIAFKPATGIFSGSFKLYFDYETTKLEHKDVKCTYEGVLINDGYQTYGVGSAVYSGKYTYQYETSTGKATTKTYTLKTAIPVSWSLEQ